MNQGEFGKFILNFSFMSSKAIEQKFGNTIWLNMSVARLFYVSSEISSQVSARDARFLLNYWKITPACSNPKMRPLIYILNLVQKFYTQPIWL
jgi:hypothetical protein